MAGDEARRDTGVTVSGAPLRILHCVGTLALGGEQRYIIGVANRLDPERFEQTIVFTENGTLQTEVAPHVRTAMLATKRVTARDPRSWALVLPLASTMRRQQTDVVTTHSAGIFSLAAAAAARLLGRPAVHTIQRAYGNRSRTEDEIIRHFVLRTSIYGLYDRFVALGSYYSDDQVTRWRIPREKVFLSYIGIDLDEFRPDLSRRGPLRRELGLSEDAPVLGIIARHVAVKGIDRGLATFRRVLDLLPQARLVLVGDGPARRDLEETTASLGLTDSVIFAGPRRDSAAVMSACDIVMQTTHNPLNGITSIEGMAVGRPIATVVDSEEEARMAVDTCVDGQNGLVVRTTTLDVDAARLAALLRDPDRLASMGRESRRMAEHRFDIRRHVEQLGELYVSLARNGADGRVKG